MRKKVLVFLFLSVSAIAVTFTGCGHPSGQKAQEATTEANPYTDPSGAEGQQISTTGVLMEEPDYKEGYAVVHVQTEDGVLAVYMTEGSDIHKDDSVSITGEVAGTVEDEDGSIVPLVDDAEVVKQ